MSSEQCRLKISIINRFINDTNIEISIKKIYMLVTTFLENKSIGLLNVSVTIRHDEN